MCKTSLVKVEGSAIWL